MAVVAEHLGFVELEERNRAREDVTSSWHFQAILLLAKGHSTGEVAQITSFGLRWIEQSSCIEALLVPGRFGSSGVESVDELAQPQQAADPAEIGYGFIGLRRVCGAAIRMRIQRQSG